MATLTPGPSLKNGPVFSDDHGDQVPIHWGIVIATLAIIAFVMYVYV